MSFRALRETLGAELKAQKDAVRALRDTLDTELKAQNARLNMLQWFTGVGISVLILLVAVMALMSRAGS